MLAFVIIHLVYSPMGLVLRICSSKKTRSKSRLSLEDLVAHVATHVADPSRIDEDKHPGLTVKYPMALQMWKGEKIANEIGKHL